jgi:hypothetical protein
MRIKALALVCGLAVVAACGSDNNGPDGSTDLSSEETTALTQALVTNGSLGAGAAAFAPFALSQLQSSGKMGDYDAVGVQVNYTVTVSGQTTSGVLSSIIGWQGLNTTAHTADKIIAASQSSTGGTFPGSITSTFGTAATIGSYYELSTASNYVATTGTFNLTAASFGTDTHGCNSSSGGVTVTCSYSTGTMTGSFAFEADKFNGSGSATFSQPTTQFNLPALRVTITITSN